MSFVSICKKMVIPGGAVDAQVIRQCCIWIGWARVGAPKHILAFDRGCLGRRDVQDSDFEAVWVPIDAQVS